MKQIKFIHLILLGSILLSVNICSKEIQELNINDFKRTYFKIISKDSNFYKVKTGIPSGSSKDVLTTGYLNKDLSVDVIMIDRDSQQLQFMLYNDSKEGVFKESGTFDLEKKEASEKIITVHFMELKNSKDNLMIIISKYDEEESGAFHFRILGFRINLTTHIDETKVSLEKVDGFEYDYLPGVDQPSEPLNFQLFENSSDQGKDIQNYWLITENSQRKIIYFDETSNKPVVKIFSDFFNLTPMIKNENTELQTDPDWIKKSYLVSGGAFYFVDLNFDCRADMILESYDKSTSNKYLEFYYFQGSEKPFQLVKRLKIDQRYSTPRLVDLRQSNTLDLVFYNMIEKSLDIFMSTGPTKNANSQKISTFCSKDNTNSFEWGFPDIDHDITLDQNSSYSYRLKLNEELYENPFEGASINFTFADLEMKGYPDLIFVKKQIGEDNLGDTEVTGKLLILRNQKCTDAQANEIYSGDEFESRCRIFLENEYADYNKTLQKINTDKFGLFDFGERGNIGFIIMNYKNGNIIYIIINYL